MAQMLFYKNVVPISKERHKDYCIEAVDFKFAAEVNSVPLTAIEMVHAFGQYTMVFAGNDESVAPVAILGIDGQKNVYVDDEGKWDAKYIPAFVRRYPFVFSQSEDKKTFTLCIDEGWEGCNSEGRGQRLFDDKGEKSDYLSGILKFLEEYQAHFVRTQAYCAKLKKLDLLEPMKADFTLPDGTKKTLGGFLAVSRDRLKKLSAEKLHELANTDELELTYAHLLSLKNFAIMPARAAASAATNAGAAAETGEAADDAK
jgi:hypothetical protein